VKKEKKRCFSCKKEKGFFHEIAIPGMDEEDDLVVPICESCLPSYQEGTTYLFHILGGSTFPEEQRPPFWYNEAPLLYKRLHVTYGQLPFVTLPSPSDPILTNELERSQFPLERFPFIDDFEVLLERMMIENKQGEYSPSDYGVIFFSPSGGYLVFLSDYSAQELRQDDFEIPRGDFSTPYFDFDFMWAILIVEDDTYVYVLANRDEEPLYRTWFKVEKKVYYHQWKEAIHLCRQMSSQ
jgi:hypothetical protein